MKSETKLTFQQVLEFLGSHHARFKGGGYTDLIFFDQYKKKISNGKVILMNNGEIIPQILKVEDMEIELTSDIQLLDEIVDNPYEKLEELYKNYKCSVPEPYDSYARSNFLAKDIDDLTLTVFNQGGKRQLERIRLELFVMFTHFPWENEKYHYWQSQTEKGCLIYREWAD